MTETPTIVRLVTANTWLEAFRILWVVTFGKVAAGHAGMMTYIEWPERRRLARAFGEQSIDDCNDAELAVAWTCLADPAGPELYRLMFGALAAAIVAEPMLLDDDAFARTVAGWRSLVNADLAGEQDLFAAAARAGRAALATDKAEKLAWARLWEREP